MGSIKTSTTHPIEVNWLAGLPSPASAGALGLTFAPGKHDIGVYTGDQWDRDLDMDLVRLKTHHHVDVLVCLLENRELQILKIPNYVERVAAHGIEVLRFPIRDVTVPESDIPVELYTCSRAPFWTQTRLQEGGGRGSDPSPRLRSLTLSRS